MRTEKFLNIIIQDNYEIYGICRFYGKNEKT